MKTFKLVLICFVLAAFSAAAFAAGDEATVQWWPGEKPGPKPVNGTITAFSATEVSLQTEKGVRVFAVDQNTRVKIKGEKAELADIKVGDLALIHFRIVDKNVALAKLITVHRPWVSGKITAIQNGTIVMTNNKREAQFATDDQTIYVAHGYKGNIADLAVGMKVSVSFDEVNGARIARVIEFVPMIDKGTVVGIQGNIISVKTLKRQVVQLQASDATAVFIRPRVGANKKGTLADIKPGMAVNFGFHPNPNGPLPLLWIDLLVGAK